MSKSVDINQLRALIPISSLKKDNLQALVKKTEVRDAQPGERLFNEGDAAKRTVYLLSGSVDLRKGDKTLASIIGGRSTSKNLSCGCEARKR